MYFLVRLTFAIVAALSVVPASAIEPDQICDFYAFTVDTDPAGTNVRAGPGINFPVLSVLPQAYGSLEFDGEFAPEFHVIGFSDGWYEIEAASVGLYGDAEQTTIFEGPGWISSRLASFYVEDLTLAAAPEAGAIRNVDISSDKWQVDGPTLEAVHGCQGDFVEVTVANASGDLARGWTNNICSSQVTTCP